MLVPGGVDAQEPGREQMKVAFQSFLRRRLASERANAAPPALQE